MAQRILELALAAAHDEKLRSKLLACSASR
jgi:hypothetical protein